MEKSKVSSPKLEVLLEKEIDEIGNKKEVHKAMGEIGELTKEKEPLPKGPADIISAGVFAFLFGGIGIATSDPVISNLLYLTGAAGAIAFLAKTKYDTKTREMLEVDTDTYGETEKKK